MNDKAALERDTMDFDVVSVGAVHALRLLRCAAAPVDLGAGGV